jgi:hypothetical protein
MRIKEELELAWLAGLIDGEGCVSNAPSIRINLVERDKFVLEEVQRIAGCGNLVFRPLNAKNPNHSNQWCWNLYKTKDVIMLANKLLPYLVLKKKPVEIMLASIEERIKWKIQNKYGLSLG